MALTRQKRGGTLRGLSREPLSSVPSSQLPQPGYLNCRWISSNLAQFAQCAGDDPHVFFYFSSSTDLLFTVRSFFLLPLNSP